MKISISGNILKEMSLIAVFILFVCRVNAQTEPAAYKNLLPRFTKFYNADVTFVASLK